MKAIRGMWASAGAQPVVDPATRDGGRAFAEALRQTEPLAAPGTRAAGQAARAIREGTARPSGLRPETARRLATEAGSLDTLFAGANPRGKAAEAIAALDYRDLHAGRDTGMVNAPGRLAPNLHDVRLSPDPAARRDLLFRFRTRDGMLVAKPNGQVKVGSARYVADELTAMASSPGYGKVGYVDSRFVNPDGSPRVAADSFTAGQAQRLRRAKVRLRGVRDLDSRAGRLLEDVARHGRDGLDPVARRRLAALRDDIARAYLPGRTAARGLGAAATAAAASAVAALVVQAASGGEIDLAAIGEAAGEAALWAAGGVAADALLYRAAAGAGLAPEAARAFAGTGVTAGFCLVAAFADVAMEARAARAGEISTAQAAAGSAAKIALDILPLALASLGWAGIPIFLGAQIGGRWVIGRARAADARLKREIAQDMRQAAGLRARLDSLEADDRRLEAECDETDRIFAEAMRRGRTARRRRRPHARPGGEPDYTRRAISSSRRSSAFGP